ncbi:MAG: SUMF1/EgtB/PvdO family nonheme iron enzyme [Chloroflexota bacterium]
MSKNIFLSLIAILFILAACAPPAQPPPATDQPIEALAKDGDPCQAITPDGSLPGTLKAFEWATDSGQPAGITIGANGTVYVTINNSHRIASYDTNGQWSAEWETDGEAGSLAIDPGGQIYVTINNSHRVVAYSPSGQLVTAWEIEEQPLGIAVGKDGGIYVTINNSHRVVKYDPNGQIIQEWPVDGQPGGIALGPDGKVYVTINNSHRIVQFSANGELLTEWNLDGQPGALAIGPRGEIYVTINNSHRVVGLLPNREPFAEWKLTGDAMGIAVGPNGQVYVTINNSHRIVQFSCAAALAGQPPSLSPINLAGPSVGTMMPWVDGSILVFVPGGQFIMGADGPDNPRITATVADFWIYRTEVTNRMYALCVAVGKCTPPADPQAASALTDRSRRERPVTGVTWQQADAYCTWAQGRLPTEAQWEKAARGEQGNPYPWGDAAPTCDLLNFDNCKDAPSDVFDYPAGKSFYDVLDMSGNVFEWVFDWYAPGYYTNDMEDPEGPTLGEQRSVRGSSFQSPDSETLPSRRFFFPPGENRPDLGFRCVVINPTPLAPYCQTSARASGRPEGPAPATNCDLSASAAGVGPGFATADLQGGTITSVSAGAFDCSLASGTRVYCSGEAGATDEITICGACETGETNSPNLNCPSGYETSVGIPGECDYQGGGDPSGCPPGSYFDTSLNRCAGNEPSGGDSGLCDTGMYYDTSQNACVSNGEPSLGCLPGYEFDAALGCCHAPGSALETPDLPSYPGCTIEEYDAGICASSPGANDRGAACTTIKLTISSEKSKDGGSAACVPSPANCYCDTPCP